MGWRDSATRSPIFQFAVSFFAPLYFVSIGLRANFARDFYLPLVLLVLVVACVGKIGGASLGAWLGGMRSREAFAVCFAMNARGAMEIILASVALESRLIDRRVFVALVVMALATSALGGPVMKRLMHKEDEAEDRATPVGGLRCRTRGRPQFPILKARPAGVA